MKITLQLGSTFRKKRKTKIIVLFKLIILSHYGELSINYLNFTLLKTVSRFHVLQKNQLFLPGTHRQIKNFFLQSRRADFRCKHKSLREKQVPTDRKSISQFLIICENKLSKAELYKSDFVKKSRSATISLHSKTLHIFLSVFAQFLFLFIISIFTLNAIFLLLM